MLSQNSAPTGPDRAPSAAGRSAPRGQQAPFEIPSLDGIRALSFLVVFLSHAGLGGIVPGYFGLTLFFFLSGYLITTLLRMEYEKTGTVSFSQFYLRRALRIFPPFYLVLGLALVISLAFHLQPQFTWGGLLAQMSHLTNYYIVRCGWWTGLLPGTWVYWSLAVEEHFYLVFPLLFLKLRSRANSVRELAPWLLGLCALVLVWRCVLVFGFDAPKDRLYVASDTRVDSIIFGCILAVWRNPVLEPREVDRRQLLWLWLPASAAVLVVSLVVRQQWFDQTFRYTLQGLGLFPFFSAAILFHDRMPFRILSAWPLRKLGRLSYSLYLLHTVAIACAEQLTHWGAVARGVVVFAVIVSIAELIQRYVERPCAAYRRRLSRYLLSGPARAPA